MPDQPLALLCQFQVFFIVIPSAVLGEVPNSPAMDSVLTAMLGVIMAFTVLADFLDGDSFYEQLRMLAGMDDLESEGHAEKLAMERKSKGKPRPPKWYDPYVRRPFCTSRRQCSCRSGWARG